MRKGKEIDEYGTVRYYKDGVFHRTDGPAIECSNGTKAWYLNGKSHREDGPAFEWANGDKFWFINGERYNEEEDFKVTLRKLKLQRIKELLK